jgi:Fe-S-cluster containining protein
MLLPKLTLENSDWPGKDLVTLEFECRNCGVCCSLIPLIVAGDIDEIVARLGIPAEEFVHFYRPEDFDEGVFPEEQWFEVKTGFRILGMKQIDGKCVFLDHGRCRIYAHRPLMCAMHPFQPRDPEEDEPMFHVECHDGCQGVRGGPMSPEAISRLRRRYDAFSRREWDYDDLLQTWSRRGRTKRSERDFLRFIAERTLRARA